MFCKEECKEGNILVETDGYRAQSGRYSIEFKDNGILSSSTLYVSITQLKKSDSGLYMCRLKRPVFVPDSRDTFELRVTDALNTSKPDLTTWLPSSSTARTTTTPTTQSVRSSSVKSSTPSSASPSSTKQSEPSSADSQPLLIMSLILVLLIITLSVAVLIFCRRRDGQPKERHEKTVYANVTEVSRVYEEIREEDRQHRSPVEVSTVYAQAKYSKSNRAETDEYSSVTKPCAENKTEEDSGELNYSEVNFSDRAASSLSSAPSGKTETVIYSAPQEAVGSANHSSDGSSPLYSTVASH
ncbi:uncharacterized protein LOC121192936 isoform X2 [Toxotes jaculatrix]|nr:uncharacterized protein LOC121192936 isoform X2 [Toxotes jaculatrix]